MERGEPCAGDHGLLEPREWLKSLGRRNEADCGVGGQTAHVSKGAQVVVVAEAGMYRLLSPL